MRRPQDRRFAAAVSVAAIVVAAAVFTACRDPAPTAEYAQAKAAYDQAMGVDPTFTAPAWEHVVTELRAVPSSNPREHRTAALLADDIEASRAKMHAQIERGAATADKLLELPSLPPLDAAPRTPPPAASSSSVASPSSAGPARTTAPSATAASIACSNACVAGLRDCAIGKGCTPKPDDAPGTMNLDCEGAAALAIADCQRDKEECDAKCRR